MIIMEVKISMKSKNDEMEEVFNKLSEANKDIIILMAKSVKVAQEVTEQSYKVRK